MKYVMLIMGAVLLISCVKSTTHEFSIPAPDQIGPQGQSGSDGLDGLPGKDGLNGKDGDSCIITQTITGATIDCGLTLADIINGVNGQDGINGTDGQNGIDGQDGNDGKAGKDGQSCSVAHVHDGAKITCGHHHVTVQDGKDGHDGKSCTVTAKSFGATITCGSNSANIYNGKDGKNGKDGHDGKDGADGQDGIDGQDGAAGQDGASCSVVTSSGGATVTCGNTSVFISNGQDGAAGQDGAQGPQGPAGSIDSWTVYTLVNNACTSVGSGTSIKTSGGCQLKLYRNSTSCSGSYDNLDYFVVLSSTILLEVDRATCKVLKIERVGD